MAQVVECVPNFSEGRDKEKINQITSAITAVAGVELLDVDPGFSTNRTVVTFAGNPEAVVEAAFQAIKKAQQVIDMSKHTGAHPRMGATDVCPFIPVANITMEECAELSKRLGKRVGEELGIPIYLYEYAASTEERKNLAYLRKGEYESLGEKLGTLLPDFGPQQLNDSVRKSGATVTGARKFLIAYNINLNTKDVAIANSIANQIRESGSVKRDPITNAIMKDEKGEPITVPGLMKAVKAVGWYVGEYGIAQLSINLVDYSVNSMHQVFDKVVELGGEHGVRVTGSEVVGVIPLEPLLIAGKHYLTKQHKNTAIPVGDIISIAIRSLGLNDVAPFNVNDKIIEYRLAKGKQDKDCLAKQTLETFCDNLSSESPAPGGGSVAALQGALSASLVSMVGALSFGKKGLEQNNSKIESIGEKAQQLKSWFLLAIDRDTASFNRYMAAVRLPKTDPNRDNEVMEAMKATTMVPFEVLEKSLTVYELAEEIITIGNPNALSDGGVAGLCANASGWAAYYNVLINLNNFKKGKKWAGEIRKKAEELIKQHDEKAKVIKEMTVNKLNEKPEKKEKKVEEKKD